MLHISPLVLRLPHRRGGLSGGAWVPHVTICPLEHRAFGLVTHCLTRPAQRLREEK